MFLIVTLSRIFFDRYSRSGSFLIPYHLWGIFYDIKDLSGSYKGNQVNKETGAAIEKSRRLREDMMSLRDKVSLGQFEERKYYLYSLSEMEKICEGIGSASDRDEFLSELKKYVDLFSPEEGTFRDYYFLCLTTLLYNTRDIRYVDMLCKEIHHPLYGPHAGLFIYNQIKRLYLTNVLHGYSKAYHDLYNEVVMAWSDVLSDAITPIPSNERNRERIAVVMLHFLNKTVAPTKSALERIKTLQDMGKDVLCIHSREQYTSVGLLPFYGMVKGTYEADFDGFNKVDLDGFQFPMYQPPVEMPDYNEYLKILAMIREYAPYEVIILGDNCILGELCAQMIPSICIPMVFSGIPHKRIRQYVAIGRHINDEELLAAKEDGCLAEQFIESTFTFKLRDQETKLKREDLNIPTDRFVLSIVGIRLDHDVSDDFLEKLLSIAENGFHIVFAGIFDNYDRLCDKYKKLKDNSTFVGYQEDILAFQEICDLYVNPPRVGGGFSIAEAFYQGKPGVTLSYGDVAATAGPDFCVDTIDEMIATIIRYKEDRDYYEEMAKRGRKRCETLLDSRAAMEHILKEAESRSLWF